MRRELVEIAFGVLHREQEESDVVMWDEIQRRGQQHSLPYRAMRSAAAKSRRENDEADQDALHTHRHLDQWRLGAPTKCVPSLSWEPGSQSPLGFRGSVRGRV